MHGFLPNVIDCGVQSTHVAYCMIYLIREVGRFHINSANFQIRVGSGQEFGIGSESILGFHEQLPTTSSIRVGLFRG